MPTGCPSAVNKKVVLLNIAKKINLYIIDNHKNKNHSVKFFFLLLNAFLFNFAPNQTKIT